MAFDGHNPNIKSVLEETQADALRTAPEEKATKEEFISSIIPSVERKKTYTFSMKPSVRKRLDEVVKEKGFRSSSELLEALINNL
ncbi:UNVERIFIED_CONTAM: hypothetical protein KB574_00065 [Streptococcus canis]